MKHTLSVLVDNKPGVLTRVSSLFARRGFNIESLSVGPTEDEALSRMTIVVDGESAPLEQVRKQVHKLVNVIRINDLDPAEMIDRELAMFKVSAPAAVRGEVSALADIFRGNIVDVGTDTMTIEITGTADKIDGLLTLLKPYGIKELARTGKVALSRGTKKEE
ncbi:MAG: acetolactate synthase small subunit [Actinobacteria bacterium]|nr:MAG: acetolactate synthase small subunit [Actinomycetota bacterium]